MNQSRLAQGLISIVPVFNSIIYFIPPKMAFDFSLRKESCVIIKPDVRWLGFESNPYSLCCQGRKADVYKKFRLCYLEEILLLLNVRYKSSILITSAYKSALVIASWAMVKVNWYRQGDQWTNRQRDNYIY